MVPGFGTLIVELIEAVPLGMLIGVSVLEYVVHVLGSGVGVGGAGVFVGPGVGVG